MTLGQLNQRVKFYYFPLVLLSLLLLLTLQKLHGSSIGVWNYLFASSPKDPNLIYGHPRWIRSDEWLVLTPWTLSQVYNELRMESSIYIAGQNFLFTDVPTKHWSTIFKPQNLAFLVLPVEYAFSLKWWLKGFLLVFSLYLIFMLITRNNYFVSIIGSVAFFFTPTIQWWYSTSVTEAVSFSVLTLYFFIRSIQKIIKKERWALSLVLFIYFAICFGFIFYPPFQIPLGLMVSIIGGIYFLLTIKQYKSKKLILAVTSAITVIGLVGGSFYFLHKDLINRVTNTSYPGKRLSFGKDASFLPKIFYGFYNLQLLNDRNIVPPILGNQCEASSFSPISLLLLPAFGYALIRSTKRNSLEALIIAGCLSILSLLLIWGIFGLPTLLARAFLLQYVPPSRSIPCLAVINIVGFVYLLTLRGDNQDRRTTITKTIGIIFVFLFVFGIGIHLREKYPQYIYNPLKILVISAANAILAGALLFKQKRIAMGVLLALNIVSSAQVNPIYRGLSPLHNAQIIANLPTRNEHVIFASYHLWMANYLAANGYRVLNGTYYLPNLEFWRLFDPGGNQLHIYNRYAHVALAPSNNPDIATIALMHNDVVQLEISPCNQKLREIGVMYFLFNFPPNNATCLQQKNMVKVNSYTFYIYENPSIYLSNN